MAIQLTDHGKQRSKERLGLPKQSHERIAQRAMEEGIRHDEVSGSLRRYMDKQFFAGCGANNMRIWNRKLWIIKDGRVITIINLPVKYHSTVDKILEKRNMIQAAQ